MSKQTQNNVNSEVNIYFLTHLSTARAMQIIYEGYEYNKVSPNLSKCIYNEMEQNTFNLEELWQYTKKDLSDGFIA